jgi:phage terminase large subunit-like protein
MAKNDDDRDHEVGRKAAEIEAAARRAQRYRRMDYWRPYPRQADFIAATRLHREVGFFAATQSGKTETAAFLTACNLTGLYPKGWQGCRYDQAIDAWAVAKSLKMARDISQAKLLGTPGSKEDYGSGMIPRHLLIGDPVMSRGEGGAIDSVQVRHVSGNISTLRFRTYDAGREALQGASLHWVWMDEEPPDLEIYSECLARISAHANGRLIITFTPLLGMSGVSIRFRQEQSADRTFVQMGIADIPPAKDDLDEGGDSGGDGGPYGHVPLAERAKIIEGFPIHEREARSRGEPMLGEGRIYQTPEALIVESVDPLTFPTHWRWGWGIDIGIGHPFAAVLLCHDVDRDWIHVVADLRVSDEIPDQHAKAMRKIEEDIFGRAMEIPVAWPHDAGTRDRTSGTPIKNVYAHWNLKMMSEAASLPGLKGVEGRSLEGSIAEIDAREHGQAWYVSQRCRHYLEERRLYHRKDGEIVPLRDDALSAARYAYMMRRYFKSRIDIGGGAVGTAAYSQWVRKQTAPGTRFARGTTNHADGSFDVFTGRMP